MPSKLRFSVDIPSTVSLTQLVSSDGINISSIAQQLSTEIDVF